MEKIHTLTVNGDSYQLADKSALSVDEAQDLTPQQQDTARQNLGLDKTYRLIEDFTLTEDVATIRRDTEPDGSSYCFRAFRIYVEAPAQEAASNTSQLIIDTRTRSGPFIYHQSYGVSNKPMHTIFVARNDCGMTDYYVVNASQTGIEPIRAKPVEFIDPEMWEDITRVNFSVYPSNLVIPAGTRIRIYGIGG